MLLIERQADVDSDVTMPSLRQSWESGTAATHTPETRPNPHTAIDPFHTFDVSFHTDTMYLHINYGPVTPIGKGGTARAPR
jgi:hypothetical protein